MSLGLYISVPFCRSKCSYCNFASDVFARDRMQAYVDRLLFEIASAQQCARAAAGIFESAADSIYFGGGTPTLLEPRQLEQIVSALRSSFEIAHDAEVTVECAPGTLSDAMLEAFACCGVNRVSLGVQSFVDEEARAVGRLHTCEQALADIARLKQSGIANQNVDLIAGLPHQTAASWEQSLTQAIASQAPHVSVYMLEIDEDSRLGRELLAGGTRYHAHFVPDEDLTAELYLHACKRLEAAGIEQYEISNFARPASASHHNLKYWTRQPYLGFGLDAHSMLRSVTPQYDAVRFAAPEELEAYLATASTVDPNGELRVLNQQRIAPTRVTHQQAWEETFFLGLRLNRGVDLIEIAQHFGASSAERAREIAEDFLRRQLLVQEGEVLRLTANGRLLSNEVFQGFLSEGREPKSAHSARVVAALSNTMA